MSAPAKYATPRDPSRRTYGPRIAKIAAALGKPPMPWQQQVYDVGTELDGNGHLYYELVLVTVPRQSGKTTLVGPVQLDRVITRPGIRCFYTAQSGKDARKRFEDLVNLVTASPLHELAHYRWSAGDEGISFPNGSALKLFAPTRDAIHGETPPLVTFDEIWKYDEMLGDALLEGAVFPAQQNLVGNRQVWMISTAGTAESVFMRKWVERGRANVEAQLAGRPLPWPRLAYFEWGMADGDDPYDPATYERFHPAVGHLVTGQDLVDMSMSHGERMRALCNVWVEAADPIFSAEDWAALTGTPTPPSRRELAITYDVAADGESGVIMATWRTEDGHPATRVLHSAPGTVWMVELLARLHRDWKPAVLGADDGGNTRRITDELRRLLGDDAVTTTDGKAFSTACDVLLTAARQSELIHDGSRTLANAIAHLVLKQVGEVTRFSRTASTGPIAALVAAAVGLWLYDHRETVPTTFDIHI
ncbi:terminase large subunit domain-containing protein [Protaetiibacter larvae]|uniref:Terminase n=1 Tax=Protaetiibacter larvae TaxID=2592654 RepID=A0A5C1Y4E8_9MICO|nr:terminase family protein [Protaetiibacter larvae]QEO08893.1 hypothetical protein FLP23_01960 [Protaetiibacter larvae]